MRLSNIVPVFLTVALAALPLASAFDRRRFCYIAPRFKIYSTEGTPSRALTKWAFAQVLRAHSDVYRYYGDSEYKIDAARLQYTNTRYLSRRRLGEEYIDGELAGEGEDEIRVHPDFNETEFDPHFFDMDTIVDFHRYEGAGLDLIAEAEADEEEDDGYRRALRGAQDHASAESDANNGRALQGGDGHGLDFAGRYSADIICDNCSRFNSDHFTTTHNGNTPAYLHERWEDGWCDRLRQKARRNSSYRVYSTARGCSIYLYGCRDAAYRHLEGSDADAAAMHDGMVEVPSSVVDSYHAALASDPEKAAAAAAETIEAHFETVDGGN